MEPKIIEIAQRIRGLRDILEYSIEEMAEATGVTPQDYQSLENGESDFSFTFLYKCAEKFGVDMIELVTGENPKLSFYTVVHKGEGLPIKRRSGFDYFHLGANMQNKLCEPFLVKVPYVAEQESMPIPLSTHEGQEFDYILSGSLKVSVGGHTEYISAGDSILYDSGYPHGMIAVNGEECTFIAIILSPQKLASSKK